nr:MAG TPA: hypothetical protein [Caudoviricetes sp.]
MSIPMISWRTTALRVCAEALGSSEFLKAAVRRQHMISGSGKPRFD